MEKGAEYYYGRKYCGQCVNGCGSYSRRLGIMERKQRQKTKGIRKTGTHRECKISIVSDKIICYGLYKVERFGRNYIYYRRG